MNTFDPPKSPLSGLVKKRWYWKMAVNGGVVFGGRVYFAFHYTQVKGQPISLFL